MKKLLVLAMLILVLAIPTGVSAQEGPGWVMPPTSDDGTTESGTVVTPTQEGPGW